MKDSPSIVFVLIMCKHESMDGVMNQLNEIDVVKESTLIDGPWRIIVKLQAASLDHLRDAVQWKLRKMEGIESTLSLVEYMK
ncbi:Lrp/AsnC ligand binding domain-containing protein [Nitrosopumilus adriaticus]|uniref:Transcriptional regulator, AsnC family n=1 Tax=Nitrosopumilus adriaticus TaxID=1580092 RepID=A0A0D5C0L4_9ARCH|nr:Lrp/AsnC ligand binding domain-containing protein [Nitrosopumilus adriaticus]AJW70276.1 Transcriptional regulator, AsnC family [Nitrosopumilus adriaticus]